MGEAPRRRAGVREPSEERQRGRKHVFAVNGASEFLEAVHLIMVAEQPLPARFVALGEK